MEGWELGAAALLCLAGPAAATQAEQPPGIAVRLTPPPTAIDLGARWRPSIAVRAGGKPYRGAAPRIVLRRPGVTLSYTARRARPGVYRADVAPGRIGRWKVAVSVARRSVPAGTLTVRPALTGALDVAALPDGSLLVGDLANYVLRGRPRGRVAVAAGNGAPGFGGDGGPATAARVGFPVEVAADPRGGSRSRATSAASGGSRPTGRSPRWPRWSSRLRTPPTPPGTSSCPSSAGACGASTRPTAR